MVPPVPVNLESSGDADLWARAFLDALAACHVAPDLTRETVRIWFDAAMEAAASALAEQGRCPFCHLPVG